MGPVESKHAGPILANGPTLEEENVIPSALALALCNACNEKKERKEIASGDINEIPPALNAPLQPIEKPFRIHSSGYHVDMTLRDNFATLDYLWNPETPPPDEKDALKPLVVRNWWYLKQPEKGLKGMQPCKDALKIFNEPNAGGKSINSEALSMEMMNMMWGGRDVLTEMALEYWNESWAKCDYLCSVPAGREGQRDLVAVSVTRAMWYPHPSGFNREEAKRLLKKKLEGLIVCRQGLFGLDFRKSLLHVWCETEAIADEVQLVYETLLSNNLKGDAVVLLTVAENAPYVFYDYEDMTYLATERTLSEPVRRALIEKKRERKKKLYLRVERSLSI